jgi:hypothetical protein
MKFSTAVSGLTEPTHQLDNGGRDNARSSGTGELKTDGGGAHTTHARSRDSGITRVVVLELRTEGAVSS